MIESFNFGATPEQWDFFAYTLKLKEDLLPVVCNPNAQPGRGSTLTKPGRSPSIYTSTGRMIGMANWPSIEATDYDIETWKKKQLGIAIHCRNLRAIDVDIDDEEACKAVHKVISKYVPEAPYRWRKTSPRFLIPVYCSKSYNHSVITTAHGCIELLTDNHIFVAAGTHVATFTPYNWNPASFKFLPKMDDTKLEALWHDLAATFGKGQPSLLVERAARKQSSVGESGPLPTEDPITSFVRNSRFFIDDKGDHLQITCPFREEHSSDSGPTETIYMPPSNGYARGHFKCMHAHCLERTDDDFLYAMGFNIFNLPMPEGQAKPEISKAERFACIPVSEFAGRRRPIWLVKNLIPKAELAIVYGDPGSGKSFFVLDLAMAISKGIPWNSKQTSKGRVVYVVAEGAGGFASRIAAYGNTFSLPHDSNFHVIDAAPNILQKDDCKDLVASVSKYGPCQLLVLDTLAQTTPGANENSSEDMGIAVKHCQLMAKALNCMVLLVHHSGKDETRGARGWSGIKGAVDCEVSIRRNESIRSFEIKKIKDGEEHPAVNFELHRVMLGKDDDGDDISSCVVNFLGEKQAKSRSENHKMTEMDLYCSLVIEAINIRFMQNGSPFHRYEQIVKTIFELAPPVDMEDAKRTKAFILKAVNKLAVDKKIVKIGDGIALNNEMT